jgi:hypothetical protein
MLRHVGVVEAVLGLAIAFVIAAWVYAGCFT